MEEKLKELRDLSTSMTQAYFIMYWSINKGVWVLNFTKRQVYFYDKSLLLLLLDAIRFLKENKIPKKGGGYTLRKIHEK
jgi:hypothetical protein